MSNFKKSLLWLYMLNKRLYKKPSFVIILAGIVLLGAAFSYFAGDDSTILRIAVCGDGEYISDFVSDLKSEESIIAYKLFKSENEAMEAIENGACDCVWVLPTDISSAAKAYAERGEVIAELIQREDTVFLRLARERLYAALYPYISKAVYTDFINDSFGAVNKDDTDKFYNEMHTRGDIVNISFINSADTVEDISLVLSPIRGILAIAIFLCAYSALMNYKKDRISGMYSRINENRHSYIAMLNIFLASANAGACVLISLGVSKIFGTFSAEILAMLIYILMCVLFCTLIGELVSSVNILGALMPVFSIMMLALCPIFINVKRMHALQLVLPPYYYLMSHTDSRYLLYGVFYIFVLYALIYAISFLKFFSAKRL